jgi:hypothetical protein
MPGFSISLDAKRFTKLLALADQKGVTHNALAASWLIGLLDGKAPDQKTIAEASPPTGKYFAEDGTCFGSLRELRDYQDACKPREAVSLPSDAGSA